MTAQPDYDPAVYRAPATNDQLREQKLLVAEVAKILRVSRMSVYRMVHAGELRAYRVGPEGRHIRVPISAVREYLAGAVEG